jgi:hypothetical protein
MSGIDRVIFNLLQQFTSTDGNRIAQYGGNTLLDSLRYALGASLTPLFGSETLRAVVLGGLEPDRISTGIQVFPGVLMQPDWAGAGSAPGLTDSQAQLGRLVEVTAVPISLPVSDSWHLVQARVTEDVLTDNRLTWNTTTDAFDPAGPLNVAVKNVVEFSVKVGGADVPLPDNGWCAIAAVFVEADGTYANSDVVDLRPLVGDQQVVTSGEEVMLTHTMLANYGNSAFPSTFDWNVDVDLIDRGGRRMFARANADGEFPLDLNDIRRPGLVLSNATWYYLYLCRWSDYTPRDFYASMKSKGILVLSDVAPSDQGRRDNATPLSLPSPWGAYQVPAGQATCIGAMLGDNLNANTLGFRGMSVQGGRATFPEAIATAFVMSPNTLIGNIVPKNCRRLWFYVDCDGASVATLIARLIYPAVSPVRRASILCARGVAAIPQGNAGFDTRGIIVSLAKFEVDTGVTFGHVNEIEL